MSVIDERLAKMSEPQKSELERIRRIIKRLVPDAEEVITYGMPGFKYKGKYLAAFENFKDHMGFFPSAEPIERLKDELKDYKLSKGTIQFTVEKPLPEDIIKSLVYLRVKAIEQK